MKKNDEFVIEIEDITSNGEGIGRAEGFALFVKDTIMGDVARVKVMKLKKSYGYARLLEIITPSQYRIEPRCSVAKQCGGCQLQHCAYEKQLAYKENKIRSCLTRIGGLKTVPMEPIIGMDDPYHYRNKAQFPVGKDKDGRIVMGFYAGRTHNIIDTTHCFIQTEVNETLLLTIKEFMETYHIEPYDEQTRKGLVRHILTRSGFATGEIMVCLILNGRSLPMADELVEQLCQIEGMTSISINVNTENTNVILGKEIIPLWGKNHITDFIGDVKYHISPLSFYQVNPVQTKKLYETALSYAGLHGDEVVWDLYCGIGTISLFLAKQAKQVYGVEIVPEAIADARENAEINGITNAEFFVGAAEAVLPAKYTESGGSMKADVIIVDPPRKGCDEALLDTVVKMQPKRVVYISCDPATLARDIKYLGERGYQAERVRGCDMFAQGVHVESVCLLSRRTPDAVIEVNLDMSELDITSAEAKATYEEIKAYVKNKYDLHVSNLYIAQVKQEYRIIERENYNTGSGKSRIPKCPIEKHDAIVDALKYFQMI